MSVIDNEFKEVDFLTYCKTCKHRDLPDFWDPCNECLQQPMNTGSAKPVRWEEKD